MWNQTKALAAAIEALNLPSFHLIAHSQGGLLSRAFLMTSGNHNVQNFITLSTPNLGQFGDTKYLKAFFPTYARDEIYKLFYTPDSQDHISVAGYWRDPRVAEYELYLQTSEFLAPLNNETAQSQMLAWKQNFLQIENMVNLGGMNDGVIMPWQSALWGYYDSDLGA